MTYHAGSHIVARLCRRSASGSSVVESLPHDGSVPGGSVLPEAPGSALPGVPGPVLPDQMMRSLAAIAILLLLAMAGIAGYFLTPGSQRFGSAGERFPRWDERRVASAERALEADDRPEAIKDYQALVARHPRSAYLHDRLGAAYRAAGRTMEALGEFEKAGELAPRDEAIAIDRVIALDALGRQEEAIRTASALASRPGASSGALALAGTLLTNNGRPEEAVPLLDRAVATDPRNDLAWHELGFAHTQLDDGEAAEKAFSRALALTPCDLATLHAAAWNALVVLDDDDRALTYVEKAIACPAEKASDKADFFYLRADLELKRDEAEAAIDSLRSALEAGYDGKDWCEPGSPFVLALADRPDFRGLLKKCKP